MSPFYIYLWGIAGQIQIGLIVFSLVSFVCSVIARIRNGFICEDWKKAMKYLNDSHFCPDFNKWMIRNMPTREPRSPAAFLYMTASACLMFAAIMMPDSTTIAAVYVLPRVSESMPIQRDMPEIYDMAINKLKEQLKPTEKK